MPMANADHAAAGWHLLAHAHLRAGRAPEAARCFLRCTHEGLDEDWQMIVEITCDIDAKLRDYVSSDSALATEVAAIRMPRHSS